MSKFYILYEKFFKSNVKHDVTDEVSDCDFGKKEIVTVEAFIFQSFVTLVYLEDGDVVDTQWTIFRKLN